MQLFVILDLILIGVISYLFLEALTSLSSPLLDKLHRSLSIGDLDLRSFSICLTIGLIRGFFVLAWLFLGDNLLAADFRSLFRSAFAGQRKLINSSISMKALAFKLILLNIESICSSVTLLLCLTKN